jgi:hypothetical protein
MKLTQLNAKISQPGASGTPAVAKRPMRNNQ